MHFKSILKGLFRLLLKFVIIYFFTTYKVDCEFMWWVPWSICSKTCDKGVRNRYRSIRVRSSGGGKPCVGNTTEKENCIESECPILTTTEIILDRGTR